MISMNLTMEWILEVRIFKKLLLFSHTTTYKKFNTKSLHTMVKMENDQTELFELEVSDNSNIHCLQLW